MDSKSKIKLLNSLKDCVETLTKVAESLENTESKESGSGKFIDLNELKKIAGIA